MAATVTTVLHPAAEDTAQKHALAPRLPSLQGITLGLIDNHKKNADFYLGELGRRLQEQFGVAKIITYRKASQSMPTPADVMDDLAAKCDAIVHGVAD
ncbi:MAG: hypothetical protein A3F74_26130 [Betaproteobacteria bacterium RIFCSPLOWO2_12_FULL_62_58]|nr:MAG: hypothetical protein A3F74_26130 [Betaproteobacteria bacterium RIFCSPLOWO2_12_FULL_62_58]